MVCRPTSESESFFGGRHIPFFCHVPDASPFSYSFRQQPIATSFINRHERVRDSPNLSLLLRIVHDSARRFGSLILTYEQLARIVLFTIRIDIRCRVIYYLTAALRHVCLSRVTRRALLIPVKGNYRIDREDSEPDPHVIDLNTQLGQADECICAALPEKERL